MLAAKSRRVGLLATLFAVYAAGCLAAPRGIQMTVDGVQNLNLTLTASGVADSDAPSGQICTVGGIPEPFTYVPADEAAPVDGSTVPDPIAYIYVSTEVSSVATVTFYGGEVTTTQDFAPPFVTTLDASSAMGSSTGPLYVTSSNISEGRKSMDLAEFYPTTVGQVATLTGGLGSINTSGVACNYAISFNAS